ncbi:hypothetical protein [Rathayibacter sp. VKM Ac-2760]|uniref:hypothetical protein n=1 Tax=Rathayibacter sp. VKM Ac-2760 TaxID=2609253 RepID=UPI001319B819|nr:hypothetical protein [Rathayibacter sp. VKM Ac-2760]QHC60438.1 hypothetical protein GSU72_19180 [Rathayibacter sp. VKM Ac-2760]
MASVAEWPTGEWVVDPVTQVEWPVPEGIEPERVVEHARRADAGELVDLRFFLAAGHDRALWDDEGPQEPSRFGLSAPLTADLRAWTEVWLTHCDVFDGWDGRVDSEEWLREGARLARRLQREVYDVARVLSSYGP